MKLVRGWMAVAAAVVCGSAAHAQTFQRAFTVPGVINGDGAANVGADATVLFGTSPAGGYQIDQNLLGATNVFKGSARILATAPRYLLCSVFLVNAVTGEGNANLTVVKGLIQ